MVGGLIAFALLLAQDPSGRLNNAIDDVEREEFHRAINDLTSGDGKRAAKTLIGALPKARKRMDKLLRATVAARAEYDRINSTFSFNLQQEKEIRQKSLEKSKERIKKSSARAVEGERIYDDLRRAFTRLGPDGVREVTREIARTRSWHLKCELIDALGIMKAEGPLVAGVRKEEEPVVLAAYLHNVRTEEAREYMGHPQWQVRLAALRSLRSSRGCVSALLDSLSSGDIRYQVATCRALAEITQTPLPADPDTWRDWWKVNRKQWSAGSYHPLLRTKVPGPGRTTFYGVPITSSRVCFIIDRSRSMREHDRFPKAAQELTQLLNQLPDGSRFNILFFGEHVSRFTRSTRVLDRRARRDAERFIKDQKADRGTDLYKALEEALKLVGNPETGRLREDGVDTFIVLSDGEATVGRLVNNELVARVVARRSRYLRPVIHTVSLSNDAESLKLLADLTGGEYRRR